MTNKIRQTEKINFEMPIILGTRPRKAKDPDIKVKNKNTITSLIIIAPYSLTRFYFYPR